MSCSAQFLIATCVAVVVFITFQPKTYKFVNLSSSCDFRRQYLDVVKHSLTGAILQTPSVTPGQGDEKVLQKRPFDASTREGGQDWPLFGYTMVGTKRLENIENLLLDLEKRNIGGDFVECGVWRGGASIYAKAVMDTHAMHRHVVLVDSFDGLPPASSKHDHNQWVKMDFLKVSQEQVQSHFKSFNLLDESVEFFKGYFNVSTPQLASSLKARSRRIALLRLDGDMYESTMDILFNLYEFVPVGGFLVVDDYRIIEAQKAVHDFLRLHDSDSDPTEIDQASAYFMKTKNVEINRSWYLRFLSERFAGK